VLLQQLSLGNFKAFEAEQVLRLAPLTLIFGPNSGGKSSILHALALLKQSFASRVLRCVPFVPGGEFIDLGSFSSLVRRHDLSKEVSIEVAFKPPPKRLSSHLFLPSDLQRSVGLHYGLTPASTNQRSQVGMTRVHYRLASDADPAVLDCRLVATRLPSAVAEAGILWSDEAACYKWANDGDRRSFSGYFARIEQQQGGSGDAIDTSLIDDVLRRAVLRLNAGLPSEFAFRTSSAMQDLAKTKDLTKPVRIRLQQLRILEAMAYDFHQLMDAVSYLGPLRRSMVRFRATPSGGSVVSGTPNGPQMEPLLLQQSEDNRKRLDKWFRDFDTPYRIRTKEFGTEATGGFVALVVEDQSLDINLSLADVGSGIAQLLPILVEGTVARQRILCVEQPESYLHPRLQAKLADFLIETAGLGKRPSAVRHSSANQWLVETHSETLMLRVQRRIREGSLRAEDVSVAYVQPGTKHCSGSRIVPLRLDNNGEFVDEWPEGFFEESYQELFDE
jgi:hypothetical protein